MWSMIKEVIKIIQVAEFGILQHIQREQIKNEVKLRLRNKSENGIRKILQKYLLYIYNIFYIQEIHLNEQSICTKKLSWNKEERELNENHLKKICWLREKKKINSALKLV